MLVAEVVLLLGNKNIPSVCFSSKMRAKYAYLRNVLPN